MKPFGTPLILALVSVLAIGFAGCSASGPAKPADTPSSDAVFASPTQLTAAVTNGSNIILHWKNDASVDGGNWIEYTTAKFDYVKLDALTDTRETFFLHPNLAPETTFIYHLQPFFGRATAPVEITTGSAPTNQTPALAEGPLDQTNSPAGEKIQKYSIRSLPTFANAVPSDLTATLSSPTSVDLHWKDHASDADGFLLEVAPRPDGEYRPCALLPPDVTSFRKTLLPPQKKCYFRVRAFFYGKPNEPVSATTAAR